MHPSLSILLLPKDYVGLKCKLAFEYVLPPRHPFMVTCMLVHVFVMVRACTFYDGMFQCNQKDNMTKEYLTIWEHTIKKIKTKNHIFIILVE